jgi:hypothetical protein
MSEKQSIERNRIYSHLTRSRFLHVEDALAIGKLRLFVGEYKRGQGASSTAFHFLDVDDARVLLSDLAWSKAVDFADYKGTPTLSGGNGEGPQSRVLKIKAGGDKVWLEVQNGPGEVVGEGAIKPAGKPDAAVVRSAVHVGGAQAGLCGAGLRPGLGGAALSLPLPGGGEGRG